MVKVNTDVNGNKLPCELYLDGYMKQVLDDGNDFIKNKWDFIVLYVGYEGDGKTTKAVQDALYMDYSLNMERIVFNAEQFDEAVDNAPKEASIVWDEADDLGSSWASEMLLALKRKFKRIRKQRLKIFLVTPTFHDLNKYFAITRTRFLVHVYADGIQRGKFRFFGREKKKRLYIKGKKEMDMGAERAEFYGSYTDIPKGFPIDMSEDGEYDTKKDEATKKVFEAHKDRRSIEFEYRNKCIIRFQEDRKLNGERKANQNRLGYVFGVDRSSISKGLKNGVNCGELIPNSGSEINNVEVK